jgi:hypothetical protein
LTWNDNLDVNIKSISKEGATTKIAESCFKDMLMLVSIYLRFPVFPSAEKIHNESLFSSDNCNETPNKIRMTDQLLGTAVIDLSLLSMGLSILHGWYHIYDSVHDSIGQIKLCISVRNFSTKNEAVEKVFTEEVVVISKDDCEQIKSTDLISFPTEEEFDEFKSLELREKGFKDLKQKMQELEIQNISLLNQGFNDENNYNDNINKFVYSVPVF